MVVEKDSTDKKYGTEKMKDKRFQICVYFTTAFLYFRPLYGFCFSLHC